MFKLYKYMNKKFKWLSFLTIMLTIFQVIAFLFIPIFIGQISSLISLRAYTQANPSLGIPDYSEVTILKMFVVKGTISESISQFSIYFAVALIAGTIATITASILGSYVSNAGAKQIRQKLWEHIGDLSEKDIEEFNHSKIITRFTIDISRIQMGINAFLRLSIIGPFNLIFGLVFALLTDLQLSITLGILIPVLMLTMIIGGIVMAPLFSREQKAYDKINNESRENILGAKVIKSYNLEDLERSKFDKENKNWLSISKKTWNSYNITFAFVNLFANVITALVLLVTGYIARKNNSAPSDFKELISNATTFTNYVMFITIGVVMSTFVIFMLFRASISSKRVNEIFKKTSDISYIKSDKKITNGFVEFDHVSFRYYEKSEKNVLEDITFNGKPGEVIGIIGPTGSGKSTIAGLLNNDYKISYGSIRIDGNNIQEIDTKSLRQNIATIYQKPSILSGTIKSNLLMANPNASELDLIESSKNACAFEFINNLQDKFEHPVMQKGSNLSGGQKQRLSIAQGLLKNPKILILDDSTSALDAKTEAKVIKNIKNKYKNNNILTLIIAQKISAIMAADNILVIDNGKIIDSGKHEELIKKCALYKEIAKSQLGGDNV
ncbi:ABC transporter ATP-binding protein [Metamycoplasma phocicerebrale]|uniref:ABC transporter ATP-binding protein n=1 Tax=Metamycoplasma phocicerebrale TaxID=142649 RepID=A0A3Q9V9X1_9BACT|nr:ABC transporter ATP-binding protein [Metamycoplasma phocicerebrale]AZZ65240.1 ABC transporter ATP-binding protein [Metamycoplasma phocicerebrale]